MDGFNDFNQDGKNETIEKCLKAINDTQNNMIEEEDMKKLIRATLDEIDKKEKKIGINNKVIDKYKKIKEKLNTQFQAAYAILNKKKYKKMIMHVMIFLVFSIFMFNAALNKAYANGYRWSSMINENEETDSENNEAIEEAKEEKIVGVNSEGKEYSYDAVKICDKLKKGDYSNDGEKIVFLTFDDGTSTTVTPKVLKVLDDYDVKATFFLMGKNIEDGGDSAKELVKEEFNSGHAIANHSYSHEYSVLYPGRSLNLESFANDFDKNVHTLKSILGEDFSTRVIRCPGGYMSWKGMSELDGYLDEHDMTYIDWNALSGDAEGRKKNADELAQNAIDTSKGKDIVVLLMHDTYGKEETAKSLPKIIEYFKNNGYEFKTLV